MTDILNVSSKYSTTVNISRSTGREDSDFGDFEADLIHEGWVHVEDYTSNSGERWAVWEMDYGVMVDGSRRVRYMGRNYDTHCVLMAHVANTYTQAYINLREAIER